MVVPELVPSAPPRDPDGVRGRPEHRGRERASDRPASGSAQHQTLPGAAERLEGLGADADVPDRGRGLRRPPERLVGAGGDHLPVDADDRPTRDRGDAVPREAAQLAGTHARRGAEHRHPLVLRGQCVGELLDLRGRERDHGHDLDPRQVDPPARCDGDAALVDREGADANEVDVGVEGARPSPVHPDTAVWMTVRSSVESRRSPRLGRIVLSRRRRITSSDVARWWTCSSNHRSATSARDTSARSGAM